MVFPDRNRQPDLREWEAWQENAYLFRSPANARRLLDAAAALDAGQGVRVEVDDLAE